ncbi:MAG: pyridoxal-phosphate dependent enzyme, partial [Firmicutes bacterium]|nr:pyridoxal-phosphate dependent enzyme [Bacillota bacterium]
MAKIANSVIELIGSTPLLRLQQVTEGARADVVAKVESFNPGGSVKDRIGYNMIRRAEEQGILKPGSVIVEP